MTTTDATSPPDAIDHEAHMNETWSDAIDKDIRQLEERLANIRMCRDKIPAELLKVTRREVQPLGIYF